jgi:hypothetical protein
MPCGCSLPGLTVTDENFSVQQARVSNDRTCGGREPVGSNPRTCLRLRSRQWFPRLRHAEHAPRRNKALSQTLRARRQGHGEGRSDQARRRGSGRLRGPHRTPCQSALRTSTSVSVSTWAVPFSPVTAGPTKEERSRSPSSLVVGCRPELQPSAPMHTRSV